MGVKEPSRYDRLAYLCSAAADCRPPNAQPRPHNVAAPRPRNVAAADRVVVAMRLGNCQLWVCAVGVLVGVGFRDMPRSIETRHHHDRHNQRQATRTCESVPQMSHTSSSSWFGVASCDPHTAQAKAPAAAAAPWWACEEEAIDNDDECSGGARGRRS